MEWQLSKLKEKWNDRTAFEEALAQELEFAVENTIKTQVHEKLEREACFALSNVCASNASHLQYVVDYPNMPRVAMLLLRSPSPKVRFEAVWIAANVVSTGSYEQLDTFLSASMLENMHVMLQREIDTRALKVAVQCLHDFLHSGERRRESLSLRENPHMLLLQRLKFAEALDSIIAGRAAGWNEAVEATTTALRDRIVSSNNLGSIQERTRRGSLEFLTEQGLIVPTKYESRSSQRVKWQRQHGTRPLQILSSVRWTLWCSGSGRQIQ